MVAKLSSAVSSGTGTADSATPDYSKKAQLKAFKKSNFSAADAKAAKKAFDFLQRDSLDEVKAYIGLKVINHGESMLQEQGITTGVWDNHECRQAFENSKYTNEDAKTALENWDFLSDLNDAKEYIGMKIVNGTEDLLKEIGIELPFNGTQLSNVSGRRNSAPADCSDESKEMLAFKRSGYSAADAKAAKQAFDFLRTKSLDHAKQYIGLKIMNGCERMLAESGITPTPWDKHELKAAFTNSKYTDADAQTALEKWDFLKNLGDAKEYIGLKIVNNGEELLSEIGIELQKKPTFDP